MRSNERLQRVLANRQLGGANSATTAYAVPRARSTMFDDLRLFALTFAGGFLFMTIFLA